MKFASQSLTSDKTKMASRPTLTLTRYPKLDRVLYKWFCAVRYKGKPVAGPMH